MPGILTMDQIERLEGVIERFRDEFASFSRDTVVHQEQMRNGRASVLEEIRRLNDRFSAMEERILNQDDRLRGLENARIEAKGAWKVIALAASAVTSLLAWAISHFMPSTK